MRQIESYKTEIYLKEYSQFPELKMNSLKQTSVDIVMKGFAGKNYKSIRRGS